VYIINLLDCTQGCVYNINHYGITMCQRQPVVRGGILITVHRVYCISLQGTLLLWLSGAVSLKRECSPLIVGVVAVPVLSPWLLRLTALDVLVKMAGRRLLFEWFIALWRRRVAWLSLQSRLLAKADRKQIRVRPKSAITGTASRPRCQRTVNWTIAFVYRWPTFACLRQ